MMHNVLIARVLDESDSVSSRSGRQYSGVVQGPGSAYWQRRSEWKCLYQHACFTSVWVIDLSVCYW